MAAIDYYGIQEALAAVLQANVPAAKNVFIEGMEREVANLAHMPLLNVRLDKSNEQLVSMPNGYRAQISYLVDIMTFDLTSFKEAATLRGSVLKAAKQALLTNRGFHVDIETSFLDVETTFGAAGGDSSGHVAMATFGVTCEAYVEP